ncbi:MAG: hypothetical protein KJZ85_05220 [Rhodobacteraceae bacterium]|jgi:hypothetical protein|nr:hypothetical protein [Paracoccaceae bacterium]
MWSQKAWGYDHGLAVIWVVASVVLAVLLYLLGKYRMGDGRGILIDGRNKVSLSRLQLVGWTLVVLSAMLAWVIGKGTLKLHVPDELLALLGISVASTAAAITVKAVNATRDVNEAEVARVNTEGAPDPKGKPVGHNGRVIVNDKPDRARFSDIFMSENPRDAGTIDLGKVQMFAFTVLVWIGYVLLLGRDGFGAVEGKAGVFGFPPIDGTIVTLIGLSHAGYLTVKALPTVGAAASEPPK